MLSEIIKHKLEEVKTMSLLEKERKVPLLSFKNSLKEKPFILEIKKKSPSEGVLDNVVDVAARAKMYEKLNSGCISVLADEKYFSGSIQDIETAKKGCDLPILCKDFIVDEIQIENAYLSGADAVLLIVAVLSEGRLKELSSKAKSLGITVLFELHQADEFEKISKLDLQLVGVNARNLKNMKIDIKEGATVLKKINGSFIKVAESGIKTGEDILFLRKSGANAFLIGTTIMKSRDKIKLMQGFYKKLNEGN